MSNSALLFSARDISTLLHAAVQLGAQPSTSTLDRLGYRAHLLLQNQLLVKRPTGSLAPQDGPSSSSSPSEDPPPASTPSTPPPSSPASSLTSLDEPTPASTSSSASASSSQRAAPPVPASEPGFTPQGLAVLLHSAACLRYNNRQLLSSAAEVALQDLSGFTHRCA